MTSDTNPRHHHGFFADNWLYLAMLTLSLGGAALTTSAPSSMVPFWEALVPVFAVISFFSKPADMREREGYVRLIIMEVLHWGAVFLAMRLVMLPTVSQMLNSDGVGLILLTILALGTFTAGCRDQCWQIALSGVVLGASVPLFAWLERSTLLLALILIGLAAVAVVFWKWFR